MLIPGGAGPSICAGLGVVIRTPGRLPMPFGKTTLKLDDDEFVGDGGFGAGSSAALGLNPGGNRALMSSLNLILFKMFLSPSGDESFFDSFDSISFSAEVVGAVVVVFGNLKPGGKNLLTSSIVVFSIGRFVDGTIDAVLLLPLSFGCL